MLLFDIHRGDAPLVVDVPHAGTHVPDAIRARLTPEALALPDTDWHVEKLYAFVRSTGASLMCATHSRYVVDLNRDPGGAALYAGADNTELCPTRTFGNAPVYRPGEAAGDEEIAARRATFFDPYHAVLAQQIERVRERHGFAILLDGHSIAGEVRRFFAGRLPDLNLGTADGASCDPALQSLAAEVIAGARGFSHVVNGRFKGGYVTRHYGRPAQAVHALQLEMVQDAYMDERPPYRWDPDRAAALAHVLERLVIALGEWRPARTRR
ncbi:MAG TPA: N-formylglutamate deformylase [Casimicrobiaceae bacterium]|jgi:N-formylglutamate amidohydrolase